MWLDELNDLVVELSTKIDQHRGILQKSESATRYCLIDPLLAALGWDLSDPAQVLTEYRVGNGMADYAMLPGSGRPSLIVEAKKLDTISNTVIQQSIGYCLEDGIRFFVITNGDDWEVYETHRPVPIQEKRVTAFKITDMNQSAVMGMLWLWRGNFKDGDPAMPVTHIAEDDTDTSEGEHETKNKPSGDSLSELTGVTGQEPPQFMTFPGAVTKSLGRWNRIQVVTVEWLAETGRLNKVDFPLTTLRGTHLVHTSPKRRDGKQMSEPMAVGQYWIDVNHSAKGHVRRAIDILNAVGEDPAAVFVSS